MSENEVTKYQFNGQYSYAADFGLLYYNARWYDPSIGRFAQADSIVPGGVQGYDRYAYVNNSPINYTDPSGHAPSCDDDDWDGCSDGISTSTEDDDGDGFPEVPDPYHKSVTIGTGPGCMESTYVECFYARKLLEIDDEMTVDNDEFNMLVIAVFFDIKNRHRTSSDRAAYDTPFWDYGDPSMAKEKVCYGGKCYSRAEVNYFAQGMWSAANKQSLEQGKMVVEIWKTYNNWTKPDTYPSATPSPGTLYWFETGYKAYQVLDQYYGPLMSGYGIP